MRAGLDQESAGAGVAQADESGRAFVRPWFAIGGIDAGNLGEVLDAGATRIDVVRAITEADDPRAAASALARRLQHD